MRGTSLPDTLCANRPMAFEERRQHPRARHPFLVRYRTPRARAVGATWRTAPLHDLSCGGARFLCECAYQVGDFLELELVLPNRKDPVAVDARIVWGRPANPALNLSEYGVAFDRIPPDTCAAIAAAIAPFLDTPSS